MNAIVLPGAPKMRTSLSIRLQPLRLLACIALAFALAGCESLAITALGIGAAAGVSHTADSISYRTFTAPVKKVRGASLAALGRMGIKVESTGKTNSGEIIRASTGDCVVEIEIEPLSANTTRMRAVAKRNLFIYDGATAKEIVAQTSRALGKA